jgi:hypothetical protein
MHVIHVSQKLITAADKCISPIPSPHFSVMIFGIIDKPKNVFVFFHNKIIFDGTFRNNSLFFFLGILISKQIAPASLFSFQLRIKSTFRKNITDDSVFFFTKVKCKRNTQIIHVEETPKPYKC